MSLDPNELRELLRLLDLTRAEEIDCEQFLHRSAAYVERVLAAGAPPPGFDDVALHLRICPECAEEFDVLYDALRALREDDGAA